MHKYGDRGVEMKKEITGYDTVSLIVPVYNEEKYINQFINSILLQDYDRKKVEIIFIDGNSKDKTKQVIEEKLSKENLKYNILDNPQKITPVSLNIGIKNANHDIIIRLDAHSEYPENYISKCVYYLNNIEADNVGCILETKSEGNVGQAISCVLSSKFGVGNSGFRTNAKSGYTDTVPFGTFRKELFERIGYFDERLPRNQDSEFNSRIIKNGGKIYLFNDIKITYHPRDTIYKLIKMAMLNGKWNLYTNYLVPGSMRIRHFIPMVFFISIIIGLIASILNIKTIQIMFLIEIILYSILNILFSFKEIKKYGIIVSLLCFIIYPVFHITYGAGSVLGVFNIIKNKIKGEKLR